MCEAGFGGGGGLGACWAKGRAGFRPAGAGLEGLQSEDALVGEG